MSDIPSHSAPPSVDRTIGVDGRHSVTISESRAALSVGTSVRTNPFWGLVVLSGVAFVVTCLICVAATLGDPRGPMNRLVTSYGTAVVVVESALLIVSGLLAMTVDRVQTLRRCRAGSSPPAAADEPQRQEV